MIMEKVRKINIGQSGADVFELEGSRILKHVVRDIFDKMVSDYMDCWGYMI